MVTSLVRFPLFNPHLGGYQIRDLEYEGADFIQEASAWSVPPSKVIYGTDIGTCAGYTIIGGYGTVDQYTTWTRVYDNLPTHNTIYFSLHIWLIDSWDYGDTFWIKFDNVQLPFWDNIFHLNFPTGKICGLDGWNDLPNLEINGQVPHSGSSLTLQMISGLDGESYDESLGFRDFTFLLATTSSPTTSYCANMTLSGQPYTCQCAPNQYLDINNNCQDCGPACKACFGPSSAECFACSDGYFYNGAYCEPCHFSCSTCYGNSDSQCTACNSGYSLFLNTTCTNSCPSWFNISPGDYTEYCDAVCPNNGYISPTDFTCTSTCNVPYKVSKQGRYKYCIKICSASEYYSRKTSTCVTTCPSSYYGSDTTLMCEACQDSLCAECSGSTGQTCNKCQDGAILDNDGVCKKCEAMDIEYLQSTSTASQYRVTLSPETCMLTLSYVKSNLFPTESSKKNFPSSFTLTTTKTTTTNTYLLTITLKDTLLDSTSLNMTLGYLNDAISVPKQYVPSAALAALAEAAPAAATMVTGTFGGSFVGTMSFGASAALWSMINYQQFIGNLIFVNIDYPFQLELFLSMLQSVGLEILPNPLTKLSNKIDEHFPSFKGDLHEAKYDPPAKFVKYEKTSSFIENGGTSFAMNFCFLVLVGVLPTVLRLRRFPFRSKIVRFSFHLKWNINARAFLENGIPIALAFFLQMRAITFDTPYNVISTLLAIMAFFYFFLMTDFLIKSLTSHGTGKLMGELTKAKIGTLYEGVQLKRPIAKYYHFMILFRGVILAFLVTFFENWPVIQVLPLILYNIMLVILLFKGLEFTDKRLLTINQIKEVFITIGLCGIIGLNLPDATEAYYEMLGWLIVTVFLISFLAEFLYTIVLQVMEFRSLYHKLRAYTRSQNKTKQRHSTPRLQLTQNTQTSQIFPITDDETLTFGKPRADFKRTYPQKRRRLST